MFKREDSENPRLDTDTAMPATFPELEGTAKAAKIGSLEGFRKTELPTLLDKYKEHEQTFDPTGIHGRRHISRALIYSNVLANIVREKGGEVDSNALYTAVALHDSGRQGNGTDKWEKDSAKGASDRLRERGIDDKKYLALVEATIDSQSEPSMKSLEGGILKSADSLDIIRVYGKESYKTDLLWFQHHDMRIGEEAYMDRDDELRDRLVVEVAAFIEATEPKVPSEQELNEARQRLTEIGVEMLKSPERLGELEREHEDITTKIDALTSQVNAEHREMNAGLSSADLFAGIERELLSNPEKYPTLFKYYDPSDSSPAPLSITPQTSPDDRSRKMDGGEAPRSVAAADRDLISARGEQARTIVEARLGRAGAERPRAGEAFFVEPQQARRCGLHSLNAMLGGPVVRAAELDRYIAMRLAEGVPDDQARAALERQQSVVDGGIDGEVAERYLNYLSESAALPYRFTRGEVWAGQGAAIDPNAALPRIVAQDIQVEILADPKPPGSHGYEHFVAFRQDTAGDWWLLDSLNGGQRTQVDSPEAWIRDKLDNFNVKKVGIIQLQS